MLPSIRLDDIETAINVTECKHFTRAGTKLHKDQTTVSKSMKRVEAYLGTELVDRRAHPVRPTKAGAVFLYWGRKGLHALARGFTEVRRVIEPDHSVLHVGYTSYLDLAVLAYIEKVGTVPDAVFSNSKHSSSTSEIIASVLAGEWDCGFIVTPATSEGLAGIPIYHDPFGLVLANDHPLARKRKVGIGDLRDVGLILPARERNVGFRAWFTERCGAEGVNPRVVQEVGNPHEAWFLASQHAGAALMPRSASQNLRKGATVFRPFLEDDLYAEVQLVFRDEPQPPMLACFVDTILRMRDRLGHSKPHSSPMRMPVVPRPTVKPWKQAQPARRAPCALSA
jgi:DNA-binding transcriptional LysR family regulator